MCNDNAVERGRTGTIRKQSSSFCELGYTSDTGVFLVELCGDNFVFGGSYRREDIWFSLVIAVCTNTYTEL